MKLKVQSRHTRKFKPVVSEGRQALFAVALDVLPGTEERHLSIWAGPNSYAWIGATDGRSSYGVINLSVLRRLLAAVDEYEEQKK